MLLLAEVRARRAPEAGGVDHRAVDEWCRRCQRRARGSTRLHGCSGKTASRSVCPDEEVAVPPFVRTWRQRGKREEPKSGWGRGGCRVCVACVLSRGGGGRGIFAAGGVGIARPPPAIMAELKRNCNASLLVAKRSGCPSSRWQDAIAPLLHKQRLQQSGKPLTFVNVGANKGYNVAEFMQRYYHGSSLVKNSEAWHAELMRVGSSKRVRVRYGCGLCNPCKAKPPHARLLAPVSIHAVEMVRLNAEALRQLFTSFRVPGHVHHLAMSNFSGVASYRAAAAVGLEHYELGKDVTKYRSESVPCSTLDSFASTHLDSVAGIDLLSIDCEGQDALVLEGAQELLRRRAIAVLEFEYIWRGYWRHDKGDDQRRLAAVLRSLEGHGYRCYWQGESGRLARASGPYWCDEFAFRVRANLVCSHRQDVLNTFDSLCVAR